MSKHQIPYQCLKTCGDFLLAARGSSIGSFNLNNGSLHSTWQCLATEISEGTSNREAAHVLAPSASDSSSVNIVREASSPPTKRRRLSDAEKDETKDPRAPTGKKKASNRAPVVGTAGAPSIIALAVTRDAKHVIAVTGEDKRIRVLERDNAERGGRLWQISKRTMPKRPCAVVLTSNDQTIISADKFGDVYALPLIPSAPTQESPAVKELTPEISSNTPFKPAASDLTVHSIRNLKALENQKRQTNKPSEKEVPTFEHKLLLGHVSLLTDVILAVFQGKNYIITADRDEHIRVSRGIPQAHVIESYCLGHKEFVSRLCIPDTRPEVLISGGGDDHLFVWDWLNGKLLSKVNLVSFPDGFPDQPKPLTTKIAVSGLYHAKTASGDIIIATCEGMPALFTFLLTPGNDLLHFQTIPLHGNALSLVIVPEENHGVSLIVSIDSIHKPGSTSELRGETDAEANPLQNFVLEDKKFVELEQVKYVGNQEAMVFGEDGNRGQLSSLLYGLGNLRKIEEKIDGGKTAEDDN